MENVENEKQQPVANGTLYYWVGIAIFVMSIISSFHGLIVAEAHRARVQGFWNLQFDIVAPWGFALLFGIAVILKVRRGKLDRQTAFVDLMLLGFIIQWAYEAIASFASAH